MSDIKKQGSKKKFNFNNTNIKNIGVNIDKNEYSEIVLSNSNIPERTYINREYFDR